MCIRLCIREISPIGSQVGLRNIEANNFSNIQPLQLAAGSSEYNANLIFDTTHTGTGSLNQEIQGDIIVSDTIETVNVRVVSLDHLISSEKTPLPDFIKIDVEGFEFDVLKGMINILENKKPNLYIEIHGATFKKKEENIFNIVKLLKSYNYNIKHIETKEIITLENTINAREGHIFCF